MTDRLDMDHAKAWHDVLHTLTELRKRTGVDIGVYQAPDVKLGADGIAFRLVWDGSTYILEETYR